MLKKAHLIACILFLLFAHPVAKTEAGTFVAGTKLWYETTWDSALLDIFDKMWTEIMEDSGFQNVNYDSDFGSGYLAGPVLGYQTTDNVWSISLSPMIISHFTQKLSGSGIGYDTTFMLLPSIMISEFSIDVTRIDLDLAISYSLHNYKEITPLFEYCKLFLGLKYEDVEYDLNYTHRISDVATTGNVEVDYEVYMPTIGVGFAYPFTDDIAVNIQGGIGMAFFESDYENCFENGFAYNFEANVNIVPIDHIVLQFGYRYQEFECDYTYTSTNKKYESKDKTYRPTVTLIYTF